MTDRRRFVRFVAVGALNTVVGYLIFALLTLAGLAPAPAAVGATILGMLFNFQSIGRIVFGANSARLLPRFALVYALQCSVNIGLLHAAAARVPALLAEAAILPPLAVLSFLGMRRFVFTASKAATR